MGGQPPLPTGESIYAMWHTTHALERDSRLRIALQRSSGRYPLRAAGLHIGDLGRGGGQGGAAVEEVQGVGAGSHLLLVDRVGGLDADVAGDLPGQRLGGRGVGDATERGAGVEAQLTTLRDG